MVPAFVEQFKKAFPCHKSTNLPQKPHYNASTLTNEVFELLTEHTVLSVSGEALTVDLLMRAALLVNTRYKDHTLTTPLTVGVKMVQKCQQHGLYLWIKGDAWKRDLAEALVSGLSVESPV